MIGTLDANSFGNSDDILLSDKNVLNEGSAKDTDDGFLVIDTLEYDDAISLEQKKHTARNVDCLTLRKYCL